MRDSTDFWTAFDRLLEAFVDQPFSPFAAGGVGVTLEELTILMDSGLIAQETDPVYAIQLRIIDERFLKLERELHAKRMIRVSYVRYRMRDDMNTRMGDRGLVKQS
jgi:hypothetical protein